MPVPLTGGALNVFDLRMQTMNSSDALKLCLVITDLVRRTKNGVNKVVVFDEAHEYVDSKELVGELENAITQIRHDGLSFVLASQFPDRIPATIGRSAASGSSQVSPRTTTTSQAACAPTAEATEPARRPVSLPRPPEPTTTSAAVRDASMRAGAARSGSRRVVTAGAPCASAISP